MNNRGVKPLRPFLHDFLPILPCGKKLASKDGPEILSLSFRRIVRRGASMQTTLLERKIINSLLSGEHPVLAELRQQAAHLSVRSREGTGVGTFTNFEVDRGRAAPIGRDRVVLGDGVVSTPRLQNGAGAALFIQR